MSLSQFQIYTSGDASSPGLISGTTGSLITILDACLVTGYGDKPGAGWTKPIATSASVATYKQVSGSGFTLLVADYGSGSAGTKEAELVGWESASSVTQPVGTGTGQFPLPAQLLTFGEVLCRKSLTVDTVGRPWIVFADSSSFYIMILTGDTSGLYYGAGFGDIYSIKTPGTDSYRCMIVGSNVVNAPGTAAAHTFGSFAATISTLLAGHYMARPLTGSAGTSVQVGKHGEAGRTNNGGVDASNSGVMQTPNLPDNSIWISPIWIHEANNIIRGRMRGVYQICHSSTNFCDGQMFQGCGSFSGKTFKLIKSISGNGSTGLLAFETSATVETN